MLWLFLATLSRLLWAGTNFVEQFLSRAHKGQSPLAPLTLVYLFCYPASAVCFVLSGAAPWPLHTILYCAAAVTAVTIGLVPYFYVIKKEDVHNVVPYLELTPVFLIVLAYLIKHQTMTDIQMVGAVLIVISSFLFSWNFCEGRFKLPIFLLLSFEAFCFAIFQYCNAEAQSSSSALSTASCFYCIEALLGSLILLVVKPVRTGLLAAFVATRGRVAVMALLATVLETTALVSILLAFQLAPSYGHVAALSGLQSVFCFLIALLLGRFIPQHFSRIVFDHEQKLKLLLIVTIFTGVYLLAR